MSREKEGADVQKYKGTEGQIRQASVEALDDRKYLNGIGVYPWTKKFRYQIDMWAKFHNE